MRTAGFGWGFGVSVMSRKLVASFAAAAIACLSWLAFGASSSDLGERFGDCAPAAGEAQWRRLDQGWRHRDTRFEAPR